MRSIRLRGGAAFADHILPTIAAGGGEARADTRVETLLFENDRVVGVQAAQGEDIRTDVVISDIGAHETVNHLLPNNCGHRDWMDEIRELSPSVTHFSLFLGARGDCYRWSKVRAKDAMFAQFAANFSELAMRVVFRNLSTPVKTDANTVHHRGAASKHAHPRSVPCWSGRSEPRHSRRALGRRVCRGSRGSGARRLCCPQALEQGVALTGLIGAQR